MTHPNVPEKPCPLERPGLYVVATPIGNLKDITLRALDVLTNCDLLAAEDTRHTAQLLGHYGIRTRLVPLHRHNEVSAAQRVLGALARGQAVGLVSDAGTPAVSDPGTLTISAAREAGYRVIPVPGANAAVCALSASGLAPAPFLFMGFLPPNRAARRQALESLKTLPYHLIFYEAPHRMVATLEDAAWALGGDRSAVLAKELTKLFETVHRAGLAGLIAWLSEEDKRIAGEFVLIIEGRPATDRDAALAERALRLLLPHMPPRQAAEIAAELAGGTKNELYRLALGFKNAD